MRFVPVRERFDAKVIRGAEPGDCWEWAGAHHPSGYAHIRLSRPRRLVAQAHRVAYELYRGAIPSGYHVDHLCHNSGCVNPAHLEAVTPAENYRRETADGRRTRKGRPGYHGPFARDAQGRFAA